MSQKDVIVPGHNSGVKIGNVAFLNVGRHQMAYNTTRNEQQSQNWRSVDSNAIARNIGARADAGHFPVLAVTPSLKRVTESIALKRRCSYTWSMVSTGLRGLGCLMRTLSSGGNFLIATAWQIGLRTDTRVLPRFTVSSAPYRITIGIASCTRI